MAASDAIPVPRKNTAFRMTFPVYDTSGALKSSLASADSEISLDGAAFADCTNEVTEIGSTGFYYIDLTSGEMNADTVAYKLTGTDINALTAVIYPEEAGDYRAAVTSIGAGVITAASIDTGAIDADAIAADAGTEIGTAVWASAARTLTAATNITSTGGTTVPQTGDSFARLGAPAGASVSADIDAISAQIDSIGSGTGAALNFAVSEDNASAPIKTISSVGTQTGTYANTLADDGTTHQIASVGNAIDWVYGFDCGPAKSASKVVLRSNMAATGDTVTVSAYNFSTLGWDVRTTITGTAETLRDVPLLSVHTGTGADKGKVYTRFTFSEADAGTLVIDEAYVQAQQSGSLTGYALGAIWINTAGSNTNTVPYVDGTADNPVSTWAAALTLSAAIGIKRFKMAAGSSITLTADSSEYELLGDGLWSLALGGQDVSNSYFLKASVSGTGAGTNTIFEDCQVNASTSTGPAYFVRSGFNTPSGSPFNAAAAGQYVFNDCISLVAGSGTPYFDFAGTGGATGVNFRRWSGGSNTTLDSNCVMTMEVVTGGGQTVTTGGANVEVRGICRAVSVVLSASETVQVAAVTGPVTISGTAVAATVNLYGVHGAVTNTSTGSTVNALGQIAAILADTNELQTDWANGGRLDLLIDAIKVVTDALPNSGALTDLATAAALATVDGNVDAILVDTDTTIPGLIAALNDIAASDILTTALVESYAADGAAPTLSQAIFLIQQFLYERATVGTTVTVKKLDGSATAATLTLDSGTTPTSITRAS